MLWMKGAYLIFSQPQDAAWDADKQVSLDDLEGPEPFAPINKVLDSLFQYGDEVELPARCDNFFQHFAKKKTETMQ